MYKILIYIDTKSKNKWYFYQENGEDWSCDNLQDLRDKILELTFTYGKGNIKAVNQRCGDDQNNVLEFMYIKSIEEMLTAYCVREEIEDMINTALRNYTVPTATTSEVGGVKVASLDDATTGVGLSEDGIIATVAATENDIDAKEDNHAVITPSTLNYAVKSVVSKTSDIENDSDYTTSTQVEESIQTSLVDYSTTEEVNQSVQTTLADYSTTSQMEETIQTSLTDYTTTEQVDKKVQDSLNDYSTTAQVEETIQTSLTDYTTSDDVDAKINNTLGNVAEALAEINGGV